MKCEIKQKGTFCLSLVFGYAHTRQYSTYCSAMWQWVDDSEDNGTPGNWEISLKKDLSNSGLPIKLGSYGATRLEEQ